MVISPYICLCLVDPVIVSIRCIGNIVSHSSTLFNEAIHAFGQKNTKIFIHVQKEAAPVDLSDGYGFGHEGVAGSNTLPYDSIPRCSISIPMAGRHA